MCDNINKWGYLRVKPKMVNKPCLDCGKDFPSLGKFNRYCHKCSNKIEAGRLARVGVIRLGLS